MTKAKLIIAATAFTLFACGDHLPDEDSPVLEQYVYASASMYSSNTPDFYTPVSDLYVEQGQALYFYAGHSIGDGIYTDESLQPYYNSLLWKIGDDAYNINSFRYTFNTPGEFEGSLETTDLHEDTLRNTFRIHVNTPNAIALRFPYNGYNQADPSDNQELPLRWEISGIDPWETPRCQVYISYKADSVWYAPMGNVDCFDETILSGSLIQSYDEEMNLISPYDSSFTLYWGVKLLVTSENGRQYSDSTEVFHFSTKILNNKSTIKIPIVYDRYRDFGLLSTQITIVSAKGDTLQKLFNENSSNTLSVKVAPQTGLTIYLQEKLRQEYISEVRTVDIPSHTVLTLDTITLKDHTPPQISPADNTFDISDSIWFLIYDDGSGLNPSKLRVVQNLDTIEHNYRPPYLSFRSNCHENCRIQIIGEDFTRNSIPDSYWLIENKRSHFLVQGPFRDEGL